MIAYMYYAHLGSQALEHSLYRSPIMTAYITLLAWLALYS